MSCNRRFGFGALILAFAGLLILGHKQAEAQTSCGLIQGQPLYANQLNNCFANKIDVGSAGSANVWSGLQTFNGGALFTKPPVVNVNISLPPTILSDAVIQLNGANASTARIELNSFGGSAGQTFRRADGIAAAPTAVQSGETLGFYGVRGYGATAYSSSDTGSFLARAAQNWTDSAQGTVAVLRATPNGSTTIADTLACQVGCIIGAPTGGDKGAGTLNLASNVYVNGTLLSAQPYATGSVTPTITFVAPGTSSISYSMQNGSYTCIGNLVTVFMQIVFTPTLGTASGSLLIGGLPYPASTAAGPAGSFGQISQGSFTWTAGSFLTLILYDTTHLTVNIEPNNSQFTPANLTNGISHTLSGSIAYKVSGTC